MSYGKISPKEFIDKVITGGCELCPQIGEDASYVEVEGKYLVIHSDPITEAGKNAGFLSVVVACNDINMKGVECKWVNTVLLLKDKSSLGQIIEGVNEACRILKCKVVGGHTEVTMGLDKDIVITTAFSFSNKVMRLSDAREGDYVGIIGTAGIEGTWILANEYEDELLRRGVSNKIIENAKGYKHLIPVQERMLKVKDLAIAMHDATEGGVYQALLEISIASGLRLRLTSDIPVSEETMEITKALSINPYTLISSGAFLVVTRKPEEFEKRGGKIIGRLERGETCLEVNEKSYCNDFEEELVRFESDYYGWRKGK
ncbi:MAG: AIR synthase family protein [Sulfolobus sp.]